MKFISEHSRNLTSFTECNKCLLGSLKRIYTPVEKMSVFPFSLCLSPTFYYCSNTLRQGTLIALEKSFSHYSSRDQRSDPCVANCHPGLPTNLCLILEVMSPCQVRVCCDSPNLITTPSPDRPQ